MKETRGAKYIEPYDPRDVYTTDYLSTERYSDKKTSWGTSLETLYKLPTENQRRLGTCVAQGFTKLLELYELKKEKNVKYSARYLYVMTDTLYENRNNGGLYPMNALKFAYNFGVVTDDIVPDNNFLSPYRYYQGVRLITDKNKTTKIGAYAFIPLFDLDATKTALERYGALGIAIRKGKYNRRTGLITPNGPEGGHLVLLGRIEKVKEKGKIKHICYIKNSWGKEWGRKDRKLGRGGIGYFYWEDFIKAGGRFYTYSVIPPYERKEVVKIKKIVEKKKKANPYIDPRFPNFPIYELVSKKIFYKYGARAFQFIDSDILSITQAIRTLSGRAVKVNDWKYGGKLQYRGFDEGAYRGLNSLSQHRLGHAIDLSIAGWNSDQSRKFITDNIKTIFKTAGIDNNKYCLWIEKDTQGWVHIDLRNDPTKVGQYYYLFNA